MRYNNVIAHAFVQKCKKITLCTSPVHLIPIFALSFYLDMSIGLSKNPNTPILQLNHV